MVRIGKTCTLEVVKFTESGAYLDGGPYGEILLPNRYVPNDLEIGSEIEVFVSFDSEDRLFASTKKPMARVGEMALMNAVELNRYGAFLDWGMPKDLFVPFAEQASAIEKGRNYLVYVYVDPKTGRIAGSTKFNKFLNQSPPDYQEGQEVDLIIDSKTDLGYKAIIHFQHTGILYANEVFVALKTGDCLKGYIKKLREDGKIDLSLEKQGYEKIDPASSKVLDLLKQKDGFLPFTDKSDPAAIQKVFGFSKKTFKQAVGALYKNRIIRIETNGIYLINH
jgi:predicted RNA-binding protein (virulence factor B family)